LREHKHFPLLFDPQTSGGLLAAIPANNANACLTELQELGYKISVIIGEVTNDDTSVENVTLKSNNTLFQTANKNDDITR
ncbi:MAG: hypothetical protein JKX75_06865, partial [Gammaproteobacteria bacterium]|nr:hypothetical protein [Gammaproteobacteria bacterium]